MWVGLWLAKNVNRRQPQTASRDCTVVDCLVTMNLVAAHTGCMTQYDENANVLSLKY